jgi:hypothetical protein
LCYPSLIVHRYLDATDLRRQHKINAGQHKGLQYLAAKPHLDINNRIPKDRTYEEYVQQGEEAEQLGLDHIAGVKGVWTFNRLPYASSICCIKDYMHTASNVIQDSLSVLKKDTAKHNNRCSRSVVKRDCITARLHPTIYSDNYVTVVLPWTIDSALAKLADQRMLRTIGTTTTERIKNVFTKGKAKNCHDTIYYGTTFALWCTDQLFLNENKWLSNKLDIFEMLGQLNAGRFKTEYQESMFRQMCSILATHEGLFPPCECTWTLHESLEIIKLLRIMGPPRFNNLFKYERVNLYLKKMVLNKSKGIASANKNYLVSCMSLFLLLVYLLLVKLFVSAIIDYLLLYKTIYF